MADLGVIQNGLSGRWSWGILKEESYGSQNGDWFERRHLTSSFFAISGTRADIWSCSVSLTLFGGVMSFPFGPFNCRASLITAHHIGTVLDRASGIDFPPRVESTRTILQNKVSKSTFWYFGIYPPNSWITASKWRLARRRLNAHCPKCPSVDLK